MYATAPKAPLKYILKRIPHISALMRESINDVLTHSELVVIGNAAQESSDFAGRLRPQQTLIDLVRVGGAFAKTTSEYEGICW